MECLLHLLVASYASVTGRGPHPNHYFLGILAHLRMVSWSLNRGGDEGHPNHHENNMMGDATRDWPRIWLNRQCECFYNRNM